MSGVMQDMIRQALSGGPADQANPDNNRTVVQEQPVPGMPWTQGPQGPQGPQDDRFRLRHGDAGFQPPPVESIQPGQGGGKGKGQNQQANAGGFYLPYSGQFIATQPQGSAYMPGAGNNGSPVSGQSPAPPMSNGLPASPIGQNLQGPMQGPYDDPATWYHPRFRGLAPTTTRYAQG